eukprot:757358-Hanusia_phi.AAC.1
MQYLTDKIIPRNSFYNTIKDPGTGDPADSAAGRARAVAAVCWQCGGTMIISGQNHRAHPTTVRS